MDIWEVLACIDRREAVDAGDLNRVLAEEQSYFHRVSKARPMEAADSLWRQVLLHRARGDRAALCDAGETLLNRVEDLRDRIADPRFRPSIVARFPNLYPVLCRAQLREERTAGAFRTIECSKGRVLADAVRDTTAGQVPIDLDAFREGMRKWAPPRTHYLTILMGHDETFFVLVTADGRACTHRVLHRQIEEPFADATGDGALTPLPGIVAAARHNAWRDTKRMGLPPIGFRALFRPWINWLDGLVAQGDHLVVCPDGDAYNVPFHLLELGGRPMAERITVSRAQGMQSLLATLSVPPRRPAGALVITVPATADAPDKVALLQTIPEHLRRLISPLDTRFGEHARLPELERALADNLLLHLSVHGRPPRHTPGTTVTPLTSAAVLLASEAGDLPTTGEPGADDPTGLLTPARVLERWMNVRGVHVGLLACVSGLAVEGHGGDALGLEWALLQQGAASVLSSYWDVQAEAAVPLFIAYYDLWLRGHRSRAEALQRATLQGAGQGGEHEAGAFVLSGDWR